MRIKFVLFFLISHNIFGQYIFIGVDAKIKTNGLKSNKIGELVFVKNIHMSPDFPTMSIVSKSNNKEYNISLGQVKDIKFEPNTLEEFWKSQAFINDVYDNLCANGHQYNRRKKLEDKAIMYLYSNPNIKHDVFLETYLYSIINKVYPSSLNDNRKSDLNIKIIYDINPNAWVFPNGSMIVTTGLISVMESEEELEAILAHEIAHFVLDHQIISINDEIKRQNQANFWTGLVTLAAAGVDAHLASTKNNQFGNLTFGAAVLSSVMSYDILESLKLDFSLKQEQAADDCAVELLEFIGESKYALSSCLNKLADYHLLSGNYQAIHSSGSHPSLTSRINKIGVDSLNRSFSSLKYDRIFSMIHTENAIMEFYKNHFKVSVKLLRRNVDAGVAVELDYYYLALNYLSLYNDREKLEEALNFIFKAEEISVDPFIELFKLKGIIYNRLDDNNLAIEFMSRYIEELKFLLAVKKEQKENYSSISSELKWAKKVVYKFSKM